MWAEERVVLVSRLVREDEEVVGAVSWFTFFSFAIEVAEAAAPSLATVGVGVGVLLSAITQVGPMDTD